MGRINRSSASRPLQELAPNNSEYVDAEEANFMLPTHITFVASSSFAGATFAGAIGSKLVVDDVEMVYE